MATDYDAPRKSEDDEKDESLEALKTRREDKNSGRVWRKTKRKLLSRSNFRVLTCRMKSFPWRSSQHKATNLHA